jgi:7tm Chemosensory receptor
MKLSTILKWSTNLTKCFGYFPLHWNGQTVCRYGKIGDMIVSLAVLIYGAALSYLVLGTLSENLKNFSTVKDAISAQSLVGLVVQIVELVSRILVANAELILSVAHRRRQMVFVNLILTSEFEFERYVSTAAANFRLLLVFIVGVTAITILFLQFQLLISAQTVALRVWDKLFLNFVTWSAFGMYAFQLQLLLLLLALNQRFDLLLTKRMNNSNHNKNYELFSTLQDCVKKLNHQYGLQYGWILLFDFLSTLTVLYQFVLNFLLRETDFNNGMALLPHCFVSLTFLSCICWSAGQLSEKVGKANSRYVH